MERAVPESSGKQLAFTLPVGMKRCVDGTLGVANKLEGTQRVGSEVGVWVGDAY